MAKWRLVDSRRKPNSPQDCAVPAEFICPVSGRPMFDPVIISSGHSFDRVSVQACKSLGFAPVQADGVPMDFSSVFPNTNLKLAILSYYQWRNVPPPVPLEFRAACSIVSASVPSPGGCRFLRADGSPSSSADSGGSINLSPSEFEPSSSEHGRVLAKMQSGDIRQVEEAAARFRNITHSDQVCRVALCTDRMLVVVRCLIISGHQRVQENLLAALVNLSLEEVNKSRIARSGILPNLIDLLKGSGSDQVREHVSAVLFSLSIDDNNKAAIGALGGLPPLLQALRSSKGRAQVDSTAALYHLSLARGNRIKLLKMGSVPILLSITHSANSSHTDHQFEQQNWQSRHMILLVLLNLVQDEEGRVAMLDAGAVGHLIGLLRGANSISAAERVSILEILLRLNHGGLRFRWLVKEAGGEEVLHEIAAGGSEGKEKAADILELIRRRKEEEGDAEEEVDWEKLLLS